MTTALGELSDYSLLTEVSIDSLKVTVYRTPKQELYLPAKKGQWYCRQVCYEAPSQSELVFDAMMSLYSISRARV